MRKEADKELDKDEEVGVEGEDYGREYNAGEKDEKNYEIFPPRGYRR